MHCKICKRIAKDSEFCGYHEAARDALKKGYGVWKEAYSGISWGEYLQRVKAIENTGQWVREVIEMEQHEGDVSI
jgi:hypothetical protein